MWLFYAASQLHPFFPNEAELVDYIRARMTRPPSPSEEVEHAIRNAKRKSGNAKAGESGAFVVARKPEFCASAAEQFAARLQTDSYEEFLRRRSVIAPDSVTLPGFFNTLFYPSETVVLCRSAKCKGMKYKLGDEDFLVRFQDIMNEVGHHFDGAFFVSNPVSGKKEISESSGSPSIRCEKCLTAYRHILLESDVQSKETWARVLAQLPLPIVSITDSGGKSLHALVRVNATSKAVYEKARLEIHRHIVPLGADPAATTALRLTRLPGFYRGKKLQRLLYLNPNPSSLPICDQKGGAQ